MMEEIDYDTCTTQGRIYKYMAKHKYDIQVFSDNYLKCDFCRSAFDTEYSRFQEELANECAAFYMPEIEDNLVKYPDGSCFDLEEAEWIGFTYRQLYIETGIYSSELADMISFEKMREYYQQYRFVSDRDRIFKAVADDYPELQKGNGNG